MSVNEKMTAIADTIRSFTGKPGKLGLSDMPGAINEAVAANGYDSGYSKGYADGEASGYQNGYAEGNEDGIADGKQAEYDRIWDAIQSNGNRKYYDQAFAAASGTWNDETFQPKYDLLCEGGEGARQVFTNCRFLTSTKVPIRCKNTRLVYTFAYCSALKTIPLLTLEGITEINMAFEQCLALEDITIVGEIPRSISFQHSKKLTKESIASIVNALSSGVSGYTLTLSKAAVDTAFGYYVNGELVLPGSLDEHWALLVESKPNWTISLV